MELLSFKVPVPLCLYLSAVTANIVPRDEMKDIVTKRVDNLVLSFCPTQLLDTVLHRKGLWIIVHITGSVHSQPAKEEPLRPCEYYLRIGLKNRNLCFYDTERFISVLISCRQPYLSSCLVIMVRCYMKELHRYPWS